MIWFVYLEKLNEPFLIPTGEGRTAFWLGPEVAAYFLYFGKDTEFELNYGMFPRNWDTENFHW